MTVQDLIDWCKANNVALDTPIALREKDDYFLVPGNVCMDVPYFGNCGNGGQEYLDDITPCNENGDFDYDKAPKFLILATGY